MFKSRNFILLFKNIGHNEYKNFIQDSVRVAKISCLIAKEIGSLNWKNIYILGLAHNVGHFLKDFERIISLEFIENIERNSRVYAHSVATYYLLKRIDFLSEEEVRGVLFHHSDFSFENKTRLIGSILKLSDMIAHRFTQIKSFDDYAVVLPNLWKEIEKQKIPENLKYIASEILKNYRLIEALLDGEPHFEICGDPFKDSVSIDSAIEMSKVLALIQGMRSYTTRNHVSFVSRISQKMAESMLGTFDGKLMKIAGYLHDIGKLKVPLKILHKKGSLTNEEWILMRKHVVDTKDILLSSGMDYMAEICAAHHERLDGSGYPLGLKGGEMFCYQRLLQVADVYSALIESRPYRRALNYKEALEFIKSEVERGKLDGRFFNELENIIKSDQRFQRASFKNVLEDIFEEDYQRILKELPDIIESLI